MSDHAYVNHPRDRDLIVRYTNLLDHALAAYLGEQAREVSDFFVAAAMAAESADYVEDRDHPCEGECYGELSEPVTAYRVARDALRAKPAA